MRLVSPKQFARASAATKVLVRLCICIFVMASSFALVWAIATSIAAPGRRIPVYWETDNFVMGKVYPECVIVVTWFRFGRPIGRVNVPYGERYEYAAYFMSAPPSRLSQIRGHVRMLFLPGYASHDGVVTFEIPGLTWAGLCTALVVWDRRCLAVGRRNALHCRCGYSLEGLSPSSPCPECGRGRVALNSSQVASEPLPTGVAPTTSVSPGLPTGGGVAPRSPRATEVVATTSVPQGPKPTDHA